MKAKSSRVGIFGIKVLTFTGFATVAFALGGLAQGIIGVDDLTTPYGVAIDRPGNYYTGVFGLEIWELNSAVVPSGINGVGPGAGYATMKADGFRLERTYADQTMSSPGIFSLGQLNMPDVSPVGAKVVVALAMWNTADSSWAAMLADSTLSRPGILAFATGTEVPNSGPPVPGPSLSIGWTTAGQDLVMGVPEPGTLALLGLGFAALLVLRRR